MAKASKQKGDRFEREVVAWLKDNGIACYRVPLSGAGPLKDDIVVGSSPAAPRATDLRVECKRRASLPGWINEALSSCGLAVMREDHGERCWMMTDEIFLLLVRAHEEQRNMDTLEDHNRLIAMVHSMVRERQTQVRLAEKDRLKREEEAERRRARRKKKK